MFPDINITLKGYRYLGSFTGSEDGKANFVNNEIDELKKDVTGLAEILSSEPQFAICRICFWYI